MTNLPSTKTNKLTLMEMINARKEELQKLMPKGVTVDHFTRILANAVLKDKNLNSADPTNVFLEVSKAAQDGLMLDGREAALVAYGNKVTYLPMVLGIRKRALQSGKITSLFANVVYENEVKEGRFKYLPTSDNPVHHEPLLIGDLGDVVAAYSIAKLSDGTTSVEVMRISEVDGIRKRSRSGNGGPWATDYVEMAKKTVFRRHSKSLPLGSDFQGVFERVDELYDFDKPVDNDAPARQPKKSVADKLKIAASEVIDVETGEVTEAPVIDYDDEPFPGDTPMPPQEGDIF